MTEVHESVIPSLDTLDLASQVEKIDLNTALMLYNLGFSIQVQTGGDYMKRQLVYQENNIETCSFEEQLLNNHIWNDNYEFYQPTVFYVDTEILSKAELYITYPDRSNERVIGQFTDIRNRLFALQKQYRAKHMYVNNKKLIITLSAN